MKTKSNAAAVELKKSIVVLFSMVKRNVKNQYRNSFLGILWTVINPLLNMIVMALIFSEIFGRSLPGNADYPVYLFCGQCIYNMVRMGTNNGLSSLVVNHDLLTKTRVSHYVFPFSCVLGASVNFFFSFIALIFVMLIRIPKGVTFHWTMIMTAVPLLPLLIMFATGIALALSVFYVYFRDLSHIYSVFLTLWMYATPIFYTLDSLNLAQTNSTVNTILKLNPLYHFVDYFRQIVIYGTVPDWKSHVILIICAFGSCLIGGVIFHFLKKKCMLHI